ncbi:MAG TPA: efflux RND transporter periplasmic adaptor subunit [Ignavibacteriaceae bacterium]|nr:efflux RND transporter periplasmic adaptor subunit [Ignavibacteriaceae bacterium]
MTIKKRYLIISSAFILFIIIIVVKLLTSAPERRPSLIPAVSAGKIIKGEIERSETLTGNILPIQQADIYPKVSGNIEKIYVDIGSRVSNGEILALIDTTIYSQNMKQALGNYMQAQANYENSKTNFERNKVLFEQNLISKQELDNAQTSMDVTESQKESSKAAYTNALTQLNYCRITAPFSGYITKRSFDPGAYVTAGSSQSSSLFTIMNVDKLKSIVNVPEKIVPLLDRIKGIEIRADALPDTIVFGAELKRISEAVDLNTRTMAVEVDIDNSKSQSGKPSRSADSFNQLKPGMFASIKLIIEKKKNALILPDQVIMNDDQGNYVFVLNHDTTVSKKYIRLGIQQNNRNEVLSGLDENDNIVFQGQNLIADKMKVRVAK